MIEAFFDTNLPRWIAFEPPMVQRGCHSSHRGTQMKAFVGVTDFDWFTLLSVQASIDEVNF
jgi:hypothetical protein